MSQKKYLFLCMVALFIILGCVDKPQTQAEKVGWEQTKYENYSVFYTDFERGVVQSPYSVEDMMIGLHPDKNEFESLWYQVFINMKRGLEARMKIRNSDCSPAELGGTTEDVFSRRTQYCHNLYQVNMRSSEAYFNASAEYRQKIEEMRTNLS